MARMRMPHGRRSTDSRSWKAFPAAARRLHKWRFCDGSSAVMRPRWRAWGTHAVDSQVPGRLIGGRAVVSPPVVGLQQCGARNYNSLILSA
eukprot:203207-Chlamydomonas_euryale.AAC.6